MDNKSACYITLSNSLKLFSGPKGGVIGPLLLIIYTNDITREDILIFSMKWIRWQIMQKCLVSQMITYN